MNGSRCCGLMVEDHFLDFEGTTGYMGTAGYRCMNCGHVHDPVIEQQRLSRREHALEGRSSEPDYQDEEVHLGAESFIARAAESGLSGRRCSNDTVRLWRGGTWLQS